MAKRPIPINELAIQSFTTFDPDGVLLVCGRDTLDANPMTISWGAFGIMWGKPIMMVMVRPTRYTWEFINNAPDFTVNWMPEDWIDAVKICGTTSGRDTDKYAATGMRSINAEIVQSPVIAESALSLECRVVYRADLDPGCFLDQSVLGQYPEQDYHGLFFGEIVAATGVERFRIT